MIGALDLQEALTNYIFVVDKSVKFSLLITEQCLPIRLGKIAEYFLVQQNSDIAMKKWNVVVLNAGQAIVRGYSAASFTKHYGQSTPHPSSTLWMTGIDSNGIITCELLGMTNLWKGTPDMWVHMILINWILVKDLGIG